MIKPQNDPNTGYFAAATSCDRSAVDGRPFFGIYYLNFAKMESTAIKEYFYFSTFAHEFVHILGFSSTLYGYFVKPDGSPRPLNEVVGSKAISGTSFQGIILPEVLEYARKFFNAPLLDMVPLEDEGGSGSAGSHWDKVFLPLEFMNPTIESPGILSEFTITFLRATGWY